MGHLLDEEASRILREVLAAPPQPLSPEVLEAIRRYRTSVKQ